MILYPLFVADHLAFAAPKLFLQGSRVILDSPASQAMLEAKHNNQIKAYKNTFNLGGFKAKRCKILARIIFRFSRLNSKFFD